MCLWYYFSLSGKTSSSILHDYWRHQWFSTVCQRRMGSTVTRSFCSSKFFCWSWDHRNNEYNKKKLMKRKCSMEFHLKLIQNICRRSVTQGTISIRLKNFVLDRSTKLIKRFFYDFCFRTFDTSILTSFSISLKAFFICIYFHYDENVE